MDLPPLLVQTAGSLVAILALAGLAQWLRLGSSPGLDAHESIRRAADEVDDGFSAVATVAGADKAAALARDADGRIMVIKRHGNRFAGRILTPAARARLEGELLAVECGEARFGTVFLAIPDAQTWADAINRVNVAHHA